MKRAERLLKIMEILRDGTLHRGQAIADALDVSARTIYRDMDTLMASGLPVESERGQGYRISSDTVLPQMRLTSEELEALQLGIAIVSEAADPDLKTAALSLADKLDTALPTEATAAQEQWLLATYPFADAARGFGHMPVLRAAIKARQKLSLTVLDAEGGALIQVVRPLKLDHWGRIWTLTVWNERRNRFETLRVDLIETTTALPEFFVDEQGRRLEDFTPARSS